MTSTTPIEQRTVGHGDNTGTAVDRKPSPGVIVQGVENRVVGRIGVGRGHGDADGGSLGGVLVGEGDPGNPGQGVVEAVKQLYQEHHFWISRGGKQQHAQEKRDQYRHRALFGIWGLVDRTPSTPGTVPPKEPMNNMRRTCVCCANVKID